LQYKYSLSTAQLAFSGYLRTRSRYSALREIKQLVLQSSPLMTACEATPAAEWLTAIGTVGACLIALLIALFGKRVEQWFYRPRLVLEAAVRTPMRRKSVDGHPSLAASALTWVKRGTFDLGSKMLAERLQRGMFKFFCETSRGSMERLCPGFLR
jgi:hypothetical protein